MKRDIRDLFKEGEDGLKTLQEHHRAEFLEKLKKQPKRKPKRFYWLSIAAILVIALTVGFNLINNEPAEEVSPMLAQIEAVEAEYLEDIKSEWQSFIAVANDEVLIGRFKKRLDELSKDYQETSAQFKSDANNVLIIESLIDNLKTRLQILKDIQEHIKILNQKNEHNENTI